MPLLTPEKDAIGNAISDYFSGVNFAAVAVFSSVDDNYFLECSELFRHHSEMSDIDREALSKTKGSILDVGAGAGSHSLYLQQKGKDITALEISPLACQIIRKRGLRKVINEDFFDFDTDSTFDTILLMMNGIGFVGSLNGLRDFLDQCETLLNPGGQILFDSTFLSDDHKLWCEQNQSEYGKVDYQMIYNEFATDSFYWLYIDYEVIKKIAVEHGFEAHLEYKNEKDEYVASLRKK